MKSAKHIYQILFSAIGIIAMVGCGPTAIANISASGVVEARQVTVSSEIGGNVLEVTVDEGDSVEAGQVLVRFDDQLLSAQQTQVEATLQMAIANYEMIEASTQLELLGAQQAIDELYKNVEVARALAQQAVANAEDGVRDAERRLTNLEVGGRQTDIDSTRANTVILKDQLDDALDDFQSHKNKPETNLERAVFQSKVSDAQQKYDNAIRLLNNLEGPSNELDIAIAEADLALAEAMLAVAKLDLEDLADGPDPDALALAEAQLASAQAALPLAQAQIDSAKANLDVLQTQLDKLILTAPIDGVVLYRTIEPGEVALPSTPALTLAFLDKLTITVYIPEDHYGQINLGGQVTIAADSFPGETFEGVVTRIADQAEYTPRNVQTEEERKNTVFAIELMVTDSSGRLKPGMPVDVVFGQ